MRDLHELPKFSDRWSYIYLEYGQLDRDASSLSFNNKSEAMKIPIDQFALIWLGPGTSITHAAIRMLAESNSLVCWTGEQGVRLYAHSTGGTHSSHRLLNQIRLYADEKSKLKVVRRMYEKYCRHTIPTNLNLEQLRGMEGTFVRREYDRIAAELGVEWNGRFYDQNDWDKADPLNRSLSVANACLHGICHAAIISAGYSPAIGFIHTGKMLSFVYDVADFYKLAITVPLAFRLTKASTQDLERRVRLACRQAFFSAKLMDRIIPDIVEVLDASDDLKECPNELEGRAVSLADRTREWDIPWESIVESSRQTLGESDSEKEKGLHPPNLE